MVDRYDPLSASQSIWLIDGNSSNIEKISMSVAPDVKNFKTFDLVVEAFTNRFDEGKEDSYATLIINDDSIPSEIKSNWSKLVDGINVFKKNYNERLIIFEINSHGDSVFIDSIVCKNVEDFLMKSQNIKIDKMTSNVDVNEDAKKLIDTLKLDNEKKKKIIENLKNEINEKDKRNEELSNQLEISNERNNGYKVKAEKSIQIKEKAENDLIEIQEKTNALEHLKSELNNENGELKEQVSSLTIENKKLNSIIKDLNVNIVAKDQENRDIKKEYEDLLEKHKDIINARNEIEENQILMKQNEALNKKIVNLKDELDKEKQSKGILENKINNLKTINKDISDSFKNVQDIGYSNLFGTIKLKRTNVLYFKVIQDYPNFMKYIDYLLLFLKTMIGENKEDESKYFKLVIHKIDYGKDELLFNNSNYISNLSFVTFRERYRIMPNLKIGENSEKFENQPKLLIFIDYINDDKYYVETNGMIDYINLVKNNQQAIDLGLKGKNITNDNNSFIDMNNIANFESYTDDTKATEILKRVRPIIEQTQVISDYFRIIST